jgi:hypothetical protein
VDIRQIRHPQPVRPLGGEPPVDQIFRRSVASSATVVRGAAEQRTTPHRPISRINRSTVQRATCSPWRRSSSHTLRAPYTSKFSSYTRRILTFSCSSCSALSDGGRALAA